MILTSYSYPYHFEFDRPQNSVMDCMEAIRLTMHVGACNSTNRTWFPSDIITPTPKKLHEPDNQAKQGLRLFLRCPHCNQVWFFLQTQLNLQHYNVSCSCLNVTTNAQ